MYTKYFGFTEKPFTLTPNPRFIYLSNNHKDAFAHLLYGINSHCGFIELIGEVGTGKTTVIRTLFNQLQDDNYKTALIFNPCLSGSEMLRSICHEFNIITSSDDTSELLAGINRFLLEETSQGRSVVLVIDEAQNLKPDVLEQLRLVSNLETENDKLIQIILIGQPELGVLLDRPELRQLNQRIAVRYRLQAMTMFETKDYIRHRMEVAGETGGVSFSMLATRLIYVYTRGVPRMINILCDRCLLIAYGDEKRRVSAAIVGKAIGELIKVPRGERISRLFTGIIVFTVICVLMYGLMHTSTERSSDPVSVKSASKSELKVPSTGLDHSRITSELSSYDSKSFNLLAFNELAEVWGARSVSVVEGEFPAPDIFFSLAEKRGLRISQFKGQFDDLIRFDLPFFIAASSGDGTDCYCIAVVSIDAESVTVSPELFDHRTLKRSEISAVDAKGYYVVWRNFGQIPDRLKLGDRRFEIRSLQTLLQRAGAYNGVIDGHYDTITARAVTQFQHSIGLPPDESVGELTLAALTRYYVNRNVPSVSHSGRNQ